MKPRIAISAPMSVPMEHLSEVKELLQLRYEIPGSFISYWDRKSAYDQNVFNNANAVVVILNDFAFDSSKSDYFVPIGVHRELQEANKQSKKVFLAYRRKTDGVLNLYTASFILGRGDDYKRTSVIGIPTNSSDTFKDWLNDISRIESGVEDPMKSLDISDCVGIKGPIGNPGKPGTYGIINTQDELEKSAIKLMTNSIYGSVVPYNTDPIDEQIKLPNARRFYAQLVSQHQFDNGFDERLLLML